MSENEKPLSQIRSDGGMMCAFRRMGCIGDSLTSGEFEFDNNGQKGYWDCYEYSWGKYIERATGIDMTIYSHGGHTAKNLYIEADRQVSRTPDINTLFDVTKAKQGYIIALGVNDMTNIRKESGLYSLGFGSADTDIDTENFENNKDSLAGWYAKIIQRLQKNQPDAKFFLVNCPNDGRDNLEKFASLIDSIAAKLKNCYVVDMYRNAPKYDAEFKKKYYGGGHMNALGYLMTSQFFMTYIDWIIRHNIEDFTLVHFIGSGKKKYEGQ